MIIQFLVLTKKLCKRFFVTREIANLRYADISIVFRHLSGYPCWMAGYGKSKEQKICFVPKGLQINFGMKVTGIA